MDKNHPVPTVERATVNEISPGAFGIPERRLFIVKISTQLLTLLTIYVIVLI